MPKTKEIRPSVFSTRLAQLRQARQLTQAELAEQLGLNPSTVAYYEAVSKNPRLTTIQRIAEFFEVAPDYLLRENGEPSRKPESRLEKITADVRSLSAHKQREVCTLFEAIIKGYKPKA